MDQDFKLKSADLLVESLNAILTLSTVLFAGLLAYSAEQGLSSFQWLAYISLGALMLAAALCIADINSLINKIYAGKDDAVRSREVRVVYMAILVTLVIGIVSGAAYMFTAASQVDKSGTIPRAIISDDKIIIESEGLGRAVVIKDAQGRVERIEITNGN